MFLITLKNLKFATHVTLDGAPRSLVALLQSTTGLVISYSGDLNTGPEKSYHPKKITLKMFFLKSGIHLKISVTN
jgi:hypothetical protein